MVALLDAAEASSERDHALVCLLGLNGLRISEALGVDLANLAHERGHGAVNSRKGGKRAVAPLAPRTSAAVDALIDSRSEALAAWVAERDDGNPLFVTQRPASTGKGRGSWSSGWRVTQAWMVRARRIASVTGS